MLQLIYSLNMKLFLITACLVSFVAAAPNTVNDDKRNLPALQHDDIRDEIGQYDLRYVTAEGTTVSQRGRLVPTPEGDDYVLVIDGETTYIGDDGKTYVTKYSAGLNGTHVEGAHLPVSVTTVPAQ